MQGKLDKAIIQYYKTVEIDPLYTEAHNNLGVIFEHQGKIQKAISHYSSALRINPTFKDAQNNLNRALRKR